MQRLASVLGLTLAIALFASGTSQAQQAWNSVNLHWTTPGDDGLVGTASEFDLRYSTSAITAANFALATRVTGTPLPGAPGTLQNFLVTGLQPATTYWFALKTADEVPNWSGLSNIVTRTTAAAPDVVRPAALVVSAGAITDTTIAVQWNAVGDDSLTGTASAYDVRYSTTPITTANWASATQVSGEPAPAGPGTSQGVVVRGLSRQRTYYIAAIVTDEAGNPSALSNVVQATTPDTASPASVTDLAIGLVWLQISGGSSGGSPRAAAGMR